MLGYEGIVYELPCGGLCQSNAGGECMDQAHTLPTYEYLGCFADDGRDRTLGLSKATTCDAINTEVSPKEKSGEYCDVIMQKNFRITLHSSTFIQL